MTIQKVVMAVSGGESIADAVKASVLKALELNAVVEFRFNGVDYRIGPGDIIDFVTNGGAREK